MLLLFTNRCNKINIVILKKYIWKYTSDINKFNIELNILLTKYKWYYFKFVIILNNKNVNIKLNIYWFKFISK